MENGRSDGMKGCSLIFARENEEEVKVGRRSQFKVQTLSQT